MDWNAMPLHTKPWFLPMVGTYYRLKDMLSCPASSADRHHYLGARFRAGTGQWPGNSRRYELAGDIDERSLHGCEEEVDMFSFADERRAYFQ